jgi:thymidylate synthase
MNFAPVPYIQGRTIAEVWPKALGCIVATAHWKQLCGKPHIVTDQRGDETYEVEGLQVVITDPLKNMIPELPKMPGVTAWDNMMLLNHYYLSEIIGAKPKPKGFSYVYADWIQPELEGIIYFLQNEPASRQISIPIGGEDGAYVHEDPACLRSVQFLIRDERLNMITTWRSRDYAGAAATNMYGLIRLQEHVAKKLDLPVGTYTDFSGSAHIRIRDDLWWVEKVIR